MKDRLNPTGELELAVEAYKDALSEVFHGRGLQGMSILLLENANNMPVLEAYVDEDDGEIKTPGKLQRVFDDIFSNTLVYIDDISFTFGNVQINFVTERNDDTGDDGRIFTGKHLAVNPQISFDIDKRIYTYQVFPRNHDFTQIDNAELVKEKPINAEILRGLTALILNSALRTNSYIGIYKQESVGAE